MKLYCLDWEVTKNELNFWGQEKTRSNYQRFEFVLAPCNYLHREVEDIGAVVAEECIEDLKKQMDYLTNMKLVILTRETRFIQN